MADYYPLIARAVAGLDKNTGDARRGLYERARTALVAQLRSVDPALNESDITRERLALEEAIRKVEAESARKARAEPTRAESRAERPRAESSAKVRAPDASRWEAAGRWDRPGQPPMADPPPPPPLLKASPPLLWPESAPARPSGPPPDVSGQARHIDPDDDQPSGPEAPELEPMPDAPARNPARLQPAGDGRSLHDSGLSNFRDVVSESNEFGETSARSARSARESFSAAAYDHPDERTSGPHAPPDDPQMLEPSFTVDEPRPAWLKGPSPLHALDESDAEVRPARTRSYRDLMRVAVSVVVIAGVAGLVAWQWPAITLLYRWARTPAVVEAPKEQPPTTRPKIADRLDPGGQQAPSQPPGGTSPGTSPAAAVAQRVVLYEEDPAEPQGKRFVGSAIWRTETVSPGPGRSPELAVRADIEIPERKISMTWSLRRNTDQSLPASHTVEVMFKLPADFSSGSISNVPGILMKQTEQTRGVPLAGLAVKVTNGFFLIGLSSVDTDRERNIQLLKERAWFDIPVVYTNNRRAILALEKGSPGERAFADAFKAWGQ
jgi:hypothetical protein